MRQQHSIDGHMQKENNKRRRQQRGGGATATQRHLRTRGFVALGVCGVLLVAINIYVLSGMRHARPMIHGISQPVLSKYGTLAFTNSNPHVITGRPTTHEKAHTTADSPVTTTTTGLHHNNKDSKDDDKDRVVQILNDATIRVNATMRDRLPTWEQVRRLVGDEPVVYTAAPDTCRAFRERVPAVQRMLGSAGMFSTGTNLVTTLLKQNCQIPERVARYGPNATKEAHVRCERGPEWSGYSLVLLVVIVEFVRILQMDFAL